MLNIERVNIKYRTPNMNAYIERFIRSFKQEALAHYKKQDLNEKRLRYICSEYLKFYNDHRPHQGIGNKTIPKYLDSITNNKKNQDNPCNNNNVKDRDVSTLKLKKLTFLDGHLPYYYYKKTA
jgi:hypothetical protein